MRKHIVRMNFDFEKEEEDNGRDPFSIPKGWGKEFKHKKEINNKGWIFELSEDYHMFEGDLDTGIAGRYGTLELDLMKTPGKTLAEKLYNDRSTILRHTEKVDGDEINFQILPIPELIHMIHNKLEKFAKSEEAIKIYEARLEKMYKSDIDTVMEYRNSQPWVS